LPHLYKPGAARAFLLTVIAVAIAGFGLFFGDPKIAAAVSGTLPIPPLATPDNQSGIKVFTLNVGATQTQIVPGLPAAATMSYTNADYSGTLLGPTIQVNDGDIVRMDIHNNLGEATTVHWHGLHLPAADDGNVMDPIQPGTTSSPQFTIRQPASTNWYHPHLMGETAKQIAMGLTGMFLIKDNSAAEAALPHDYGNDDIPLILQSEVVNANGQVVSNEDLIAPPNNNTFPLLVNGVNVTTTPANVPTINPTSSRIRLRVLNASIGDILTLSFADGQAFNEVATDGGFLPSPLPVTNVRVGPAERVDIVVDLTHAVTLQATVEAALITGGSGTHPILQINPLDTTPAPPLPTTLNTIAPLNTTGSVRRDINLSYNPAPGASIFTGFGINGVVGDTMPAMMNNAISVPVGTTEVWNINNLNTPQTHFFHMHDGSFQILSVNGAPPTGDKVGWKDTVEVPPGQTVQIAFKFTDYTDTNLGYMLHCHLSPHEDRGMMALFYVVPVFKNNQGRQMSDLDGDGRSDYIVYRPGNQVWYVIPSGGSVPYTRQWGLPGDIPLNADFDGDGKSDIVVWRPANGTWYVIPSGNPGAAFTKQWGLPGDIPLSADFDGDGKSDFVVWRPSNGTWYIMPSSNPSAPYTKQWGLTGDVPLVADFDNDGQLDFVVWRPQNGVWYILPSSNPSEPLLQQWGLPGDTPLIGDFDGDGKNDFVVWRPSNGTWYIIPSGKPAEPFTQQWGLPGDVPLARDFDGDKKTDFAVWRPGNGSWYVIPSTNPAAPYIQQWGLPGDSPL
jgi:suppressor of ftsI/bilirubin oxidase